MNKQKGFSLIETVVYLFILSILSVALISSLVVMIRSLASSRIERNINQAAVSALDRVVQEIRKANAATVSGSTQLSLSTIDLNDNSTTVQFSLQDGVLQIQSGAGAAVPLTIGHIQVSSLTFTKITTAHSEAVKIALSLTDNRGQNPPVLNFQTTAVLRGAY